MATKAQHDVLVHLVAEEERRQRPTRDVTGSSQEIEYSGGDLIDYYHQRYLRSITSTAESTLWLAPHLTAGSPRSHAWRRAGGTVLKRLADDGYMEFVQFVYGVPQYVLTDKGREEAKNV